MGIDFNTGDYKESASHFTTETIEWIGEVQDIKITNKDYLEAVKSIMTEDMKDDIDSLTLASAKQRLTNICNSNHDYFGDKSVWLIYPLLLCLKKNSINSKNSQFDFLDDLINLFAYAHKHHVCIMWEW
jgi:hypothetical protein